MVKKIVLSVLALFVGPLVVLVMSLFYNWSIYGALGTACVVSFFAVQGVWQTASVSKNKAQQSVPADGPASRGRS